MPCHTVYVARHGETAWNAAGRWQGHTDVPLNATGRAQARALADALRNRALAGVVASDLKRATETAQIVAFELGIALAYVDADLRERCFGVFEGLTREECEASYAEEWQAWTLRQHPPRGAERDQDLMARAVVALDRVATQVACVDAPALAVAHGGTMRALVRAATGQNVPPMKNGALWRFEWDGAILHAAAAS